MKVAIIKLGALGDMIVASPAIRSIIEAHSEGEITLLTRPQYADLFSACAGLNTMYFPAHGVPAFIACIRWLRSQGFERIYDLQSNDRSRLMCYLSGALEKVGNHSRFPYTHHPGDVYRGQTHIYERHRQTLHSAGIEMKYDRPWLPVSEQASEKVKQWLQDNTRASHKPVLMHAGTSPAHPEKRWPYFAEIAEKVVALGYPVIWLGGKDDADLNAALATNFGIDASGVFSFPELVALGRQSRLALTNDSGPMHILSCANLPVYALFGPTDWRRYHALGQEDKVISLDKGNATWNKNQLAGKRAKELSDLDAGLVWSILAPVFHTDQ